MSNRSSIALIGLLLVAACSQANSFSNPVARGVNHLAWELVRFDAQGNTVVSPVSVWQALALAHAGASGHTAAEIAHVLGMPNDRNQIVPTAVDMRQRLKLAEALGIKMNLANALWYERSLNLNADIAGLFSHEGTASVRPVGFEESPEKACRDINDWVSGITANKIPKLLRPGSLKPTTKMVITNAIYMKAPWAEPFEKDLTENRDFHIAKSHKVRAPFMHQSGRWLAGTVGTGFASARTCLIPYRGQELAMLIVVPDALTGLDHVLASLGDSTLAEWREQALLTERKVVVDLPRWTAHRQLDLTKALAEMGMNTAFSASADFSGFFGRPDITVDKVIHEGFVEVLEEGTEAAAATAMTFQLTSAMRPIKEEPFVIRADRPFLWAIMELKSDDILFAGVVRDPSRNP